MPGQTVYSVLMEEKGGYRRLDCSAEKWKEFFASTVNQGDKTIGWWKTRIPTPSDKKAKLAPNEILLRLFEQLAEQWDKQEMRYLLALLLIRRRLFRVEREEEIEGQKKLTVYFPKQDTTFEIVVAKPPKDRIEQIQNELAALLAG